MTAGFLILLFLLLALVIRLIAGSTDRGRIASYVERKGGRVVSITWAPFGTGWFGEKNARIYEVVYYDSGGRQHMATCKTSLFAGVYWTEDKVSHRRPSWHGSLSTPNRPGDPIIRRVVPPPEDSDDDEIDRLREENARLREELDRLNPGR